MTEKMQKIIDTDESPVMEALIPEINKLDMKAKLAAMIAAKPATYPENPYWGMKDNFIFDKESNAPMNLELINSIKPIVLQYFQLNYDAFKCESQVLVMRENDASWLVEKGIPELDLSLVALPSEYERLHIFVLPQVNTWGNTSVSETFWQNEIIKEGLTPLMRIHSHHVLNAYQSITDWSSLNSGTLEVVFGKIYDETPEIAFWLDIRGTENKDNVFKTVDAGETIEQIENGNVKQQQMLKYKEMTTTIVEPVTEEELEHPF